MPKTIVINHRYLLIHEDDMSDLDTIGIDNEPNGKVLHRIPLIGVETKIKKSSMFNKNASNVVIKANNGEIIIELAFQSFKDHYAMFKWTEAVRSAVEMISECSDPLTKIYQIHNLRPSYFASNEHVDCKSVLLPSKSSINLQERLDVPNGSLRRPSAPELNQDEDEVDVDDRRSEASGGAMATLTVPGGHLEDDSKSDSGVEFQDDEIFHRGAVVRVPRPKRKGTLPKRKYGVIIHLDGMAGSTIVTTREE